MELFQGSQRKSCTDMRSLGQLTMALSDAPKWVPLKIPKSQQGELYLRLPAGEISLGISTTHIPGCVGSIGGRTGLRLADPCFRLEKPVAHFAPEQALTAPVRTESSPNQWRAVLPAHMELSLPAGHARQLQLLFDTDLNRDYNQLKPDYYGNGWDAMPAALVRHFRVLTQQDGQWVCLTEQTENHQRCCALSLPDQANGVRIELLASWGGSCAGLYGVRLRTALPHFREEVFPLPGAKQNHPGQGTVYLAVPENNGQKLPVLLAIHGSHRGALDYRDTPFYAQQRNIALSHGYLFACVDNGSDTWGLDDGLSNNCLLWEYLQEHYPVESRVVVWATSAGGTLACRMAAEHPEKVAKILGTFPVYDLEAAFRDLPSCRKAWGTSDPEEFRTRIQGRNPAQFPQKLTRHAFYITHGDADDAVPIADHSVRLQQEAGQNVQVQVIPGGTHGTDNMAFYKTITQIFMEDAL